MKSNNATGPTLSTVLFVVGLALTALIRGTPWKGIGIAMMVIVVLINIGLLLAERNKQR